MTADSRFLSSRREFLATTSLAVGAAVISPRAFAQDPALDWDWLVGNWDVWHRRLKKRLAGNDEWDEFAGKSSFRHTLGGLGNVDDNLLHLPAGTYRAISVRAFDPATRKWAIWWLDGRTAAKLDPPVLGGFTGDEGEFIGTDTYEGKPVVVRFRWHEVHGKRPHWDQAFSPDGGKTWETNWRNYFTRTQSTPSPIPRVEGPPPAEASDWNFLAGRWRVRNRKRRTAGGSWEEFDSQFNNWPVMGGLGNIGDNVFHAPSGTYRGMSIRAFDTQAKQWRTWWLDGRKPHTINSSVAGTFKDGVGTLLGEDDVDGRKVRVRSQWSRIATSSPRWEQATSRDGVNWDTDWTADFTRDS
jgi:hypothetical protein